MASLRFAGVELTRIRRVLVRSFALTMVLLDTLYIVFAVKSDANIGESIGLCKLYGKILPTRENRRPSRWSFMREMLNITVTNKIISKTFGYFPKN